MKIYQGKIVNHNPIVEVTKSDGNVTDLDPKRSQAIVNLNSDGFNWGYDGCKPAQLALAILLDVTNDASIALGHYQAFKDACVRHWSDTWELSSETVRTWLIARCVDVKEEVCETQ